MKYIRNGHTFEITLDEFIRLNQMGFFEREVENADDIGELPPNRGGQAVSITEAAIEDKLDAELHQRTTMPGKRDMSLINADLFFRNFSPKMAKVVVALYECGGTATMTQITKRTGLKGPSLRKPNGALNHRIQEATSNRIQSFCIIEKPTRANELSEAKYSLRSEISLFIQNNIDKITAISNGEP